MMLVQKKVARVLNIIIIIIIIIIFILIIIIIIRPEVNSDGRDLTADCRPGVSLSEVESDLFGK